ncbi:MAG: DUF2892 domain-containing protein [Calditrichaeota bacterium]|nr:MAG: DUF2892 domain-containing protein [Calditrichota bacterium]
MENKNSFRETFQNFKSGKTGRSIDIVLGTLLIGYALFFDSYRIFACIVGFLAFTAGAFNVCWAAPLIGIPFKGKSKAARRNKN